MRILHKIIVLSLLMPDVFAASSTPDLIGGAAAALAAVPAAPATQDPDPLAGLAVSQASNGTGSQSSSATVVASPLSTVSPGVLMNNSKVTWGFLVDPAKQAAMEAAAALEESSLKPLGALSAKASSRSVPGPPYIASVGAAARASTSTGGLIPDKSLRDHSLSLSASAGAGAAAGASASANGLLPAAALAAAYPISAGSARSFTTVSEVPDNARAESPVAGAAAERRQSAFPIGAQQVGVSARA